MKIENIFFDLDGTLIDSSPGIEYSIQEAMAAVAPGEKITGVRDLIGPPIREILKRVWAPGQPETLERLERAFRESYDHSGWKKSIPYEGVRETLGHLLRLGIKNFIVTNKPATPTRKILHHLKLDAFFQAVVSPDCHTPPFNSKIQESVYLLQNFSLDPVQTLLVGDSRDDAQVAQACGFWFAAAAYGYGKVHLMEDYRKDRVLQNFSNLLEFIDEGTGVRRVNPRKMLDGNGG